MSAAVLFWLSYLGVFAAGAWFAVAVLFFIAYRLWRRLWVDQ